MLHDCTADDALGEGCEIYTWLCSSSLSWLATDTKKTGILEMRSSDGFIHSLHSRRIYLNISK